MRLSEMSMVPTAHSHDVEAMADVVTVVSTVDYSVVDADDADVVADVVTVVETGVETEVSESKGISRTF
eukprot:m.264413 g.264413  ORF g.264413 m.264413 type:complete len:69 (+) comp56108_c0_seq1:174-380(+)